MQYSVRVEMIIAGDDPAALSGTDRDRLAAAVAAQAGVPPSSVRLRVQAGSLLLTFDIDVDPVVANSTQNYAQAKALETSLASQLTTPESATALLAPSGVANITVLSAPADVITTIPRTLQVPASPPSPDSPVPWDWPTASPSPPLSPPVLSAIAAAFAEAQEAAEAATNGKWIPLLIGVGVGGLLLGCLFALMVWCCFCRRKGNKGSSSSSYEMASVGGSEVDAREVDVKVTDPGQAPLGGLTAIERARSNQLAT